MNPTTTRPLDQSKVEVVARELDPPAWKLYDLEGLDRDTCPAWLSNVIAPSLRLAETALADPCDGPYTGMVARFSEAVRSHPIGPLSRRQPAELSNLAHWTRKAVRT